MRKFSLMLIMILLQSTNIWAKETNLSILENDFIECSNSLEKEYEKCPEAWNMDCYRELMKAHKNTQKCYKSIAVKLFKEFYGLSETEAEKRYNDYSNFMYNQYLFVFSETNYCKKHNCGTALYLYSEYATTEQLRYYVNKIIKSITVNNQ